MVDPSSLPVPLMRHRHLPFCALGPSTRHLLAWHLNPKRSGLSPTTYRLQDWRGLAEELGFTSQIDVDNFEQKDNPTIEILGLWSRLNPNALIGDVLRALTEIERYDILHFDALHAAIDRDADNYQAHVAQLEARPPDPIQVPNVDSSWDEFANIIVGEVETGRREHFDAFVCYTAADASFVHEMIYNLENIHGLRLFIKERNMVAGGADNVLLAELVKSRCNKMVIVMSPDYEQSAECKFLTRFAQALQPGADKRTLIPIKYRHCAIPDILRFIAILDYTRQDTRPWFWQRLASSLRTATSQSAILHPFVVGPGYPLTQPVDYAVHQQQTWSLPVLAPASVPDSAAADSDLATTLDVVPSHFSAEVLHSFETQEPRHVHTTGSTARRRSSRHHPLTNTNSPTTKLAAFLTKSKKK